MNYCYHTTKTNFLSSILKNGLQPMYGDNSHLIADIRAPQIYYSVGIQGAADTFGGFNRFYGNVLDDGINEENFRQELQPQEYVKHLKCIESIKNSFSFEDWVKDNIYLCFDGNYLSEKNEDKPADSFTTQQIPANQLKVCVIKNKKDNAFYSYSMVDIYSFFFAKNPELKKGLCTYDYKENIDKFKSDEYYIEHIGLEKFCEMFPEVLLKDDNSKKEKISTNTLGKRTISADTMDKSIITGNFKKIINIMKGIYRE